MHFSEIYKKLNHNQQKAVDKIDGTVMVVAGPGTGKTEVLGARIANILLHTDTQPENILCLTFTEAATTELRKRLNSFIGSASYKVNIYTYHSFCNMVIQENKDVFGIQHLEAISELEVIEVLREIIDELPNQSLLKRYVGDVYYEVRPLRNLFGLLKKDNLSSADIAMKIKVAKSEALNDESFYYKRKTGNKLAGDLNEKKYALFSKGLDKLKEASQLLDVYEQKLKIRNRYDFNDMLRWVLNVFQSDETLLLKYQEAFHYFLVDEYQDTNGIQNDLLYVLINYWENPNVFVVGDDDQSIFKFQGANVENIRNFYLKYRPFVNLVVLDQNYRSSQHILDASNYLIQNNNERLVGIIPDINKNIVASNSDIATIHPAIHVMEYPNTFHEIVSLTTKLKDLVNQGVSLSDIGILYRKHSQSIELIKYLEREGISYSVAKTQDVLQVPIVNQLNTFLTYIACEAKKLDSGHHLLFSIMYSHDFNHITSLDIGKMSNQISKDKSRGWREQLHNIDSQLDISHESVHELKLFLKDIDYWVKELHKTTLQDFVEKFMSKLGFVSDSLKSQDANFKIQCLKTYYNFLKEETARNPYLLLTEFLEKIELLKVNKIGLKLNKIIYGVNGVNLMTVHSSKGLQFDYVFMIGCTENNWEKEKNDLPFRLNIILPGEPKEALKEESRRLFYVGLTRARKHLELSYFEKDEKEKPIVRSLFVEEVLESKTCNVENVFASESDILHFFDFMLQPKEQKVLSLYHQDFVKKEVENFRMSATNLNSYLKCPVSFFYQNIIRVPSAKNDTMTFGSAIHAALDELYSSSRSVGSSEDAIDILRNTFTQKMKASRESFTDANFERRIFYGNTILSKYYKAYENEIKKEVNVETEVYLNNCEIEGIPIRGQIDKLVLNGREAHVVDFKTGQYKYGKTKINPPISLEDNPHEKNFEKRCGGDYWRQILFYKALLESNKSNPITVLSGEIDFIEPVDDTFKKHTINFNEEEYMFVKNQIKDSYQRIQNLEFDQGCNEDDCYWCSFNTYS